MTNLILPEFMLPPVPNPRDLGGCNLCTKSCFCLLLCEKCNGSQVACRNNGYCTKNGTSIIALRYKCGGKQR